MTGDPTYDAIDAKILVTRRNRILARLQLISESPAVRLDRPRVSGSRAGSKPPPEADPEREGPPDINRSLYDHFLWHFRHAKDPEHVRRLCSIAEARYHEHVRGNRQDAREKPEDRTRRILRDYEGWPAFDAALVEGCTEKHIRTLRKQAGRDQGWGFRDAASPKGADERMAQLAAQLPLVPA